MLFEAKVLNANSVVLTIGGSQVLFSYETPVAARIDGFGYVRTETSHSVTTSKHLGRWADYKRHLPQEWFDKLPALLAKREAAELLADDMRDLTSCLMEQEFRSSRAGRYAEELKARLKSWDNFDMPPEWELVKVGRKHYEFRIWKGQDEWRRKGETWVRIYDYTDEEGAPFGKAIAKHRKA